MVQPGPTSWTILSWDLKTLKRLLTYVHLSVWKQLLTNFNHSKYQGQTGSILYYYRKVGINWMDITTSFFKHAWDTAMCHWYGKKAQVYFFPNPESSDVVETLMVETETKTETWKKFEFKTRDQDLKKFSRPRSRLGEFFETETRLRDPRF